MKWSAAPHAIGRIRERFGIRGRDADVTAWVNQRMAVAQYVGTIPDDEGKMRRVYTAGTAVIFALVDGDCVISVRRAKVQTEWRANLEKVAERELRKLKRQSIAEERRLVALRSQMETELCEQRARSLSARSDAKRFACDARVNALTMRLTEIERDIIRVRRDVLKAAESYAAIS